MRNREGKTVEADLEQQQLSQQLQKAIEQLQEIVASGKPLDGPLKIEIVLNANFICAGPNAEG